MVITAKNIGHFVIAFSLFQISCGNNHSNSTYVTIPESETNQYQSDTVGAAKNQNPEVLNIEEHIRYPKTWYREQGDSMVLDTSNSDVITVDIKIQEGKLYYKKTEIVGGTQKAWFSEMESNLKKNGAVGVSGFGSYTRIHTDAKIYIVSKTIKKILEMLPNQFIRTHRSFAVHQKQLRSLMGNKVLLHNGEQVKVSKSGRQVILDHFNKAS